MAKITTAKEALAAVQQDGWALEHVPENFKTAELYRIIPKRKYNA